MFLFLMSFLPGTLVAILSFFGFSSNREKGISFLKNVALGMNFILIYYSSYLFKGNGKRSPVATMILAAYGLFLPHGFSDNEALLAETTNVFIINI